jgi:glycerophosphoryl diester phosphodiesterase
MLVALVSGVVFLERIDLTRRIAVTAHRGSSMKAPENTLSALRQAAADGAEYAEIDVQTTADGVVVLMHDADLMRIAAINRKIYEVGYDELKDIDIGSWFSHHFGNERISTLEEAIDFARGRIKLNIELKYNRPDPGLANEVVRIIREKGFLAECVVSSLDSQALKSLKERLPEVKAGLIVFRALGNLSQTEWDFVSIHAGRATRSLVKNAHRSGKEVHVWTVNDFHNALSMIELGVDNIITDDPEGLKNLLQEWNDLSDTGKIALLLRNLFRGDLSTLPL